MGTIMGISERSRTVEVLFDDERTVHYDFADMAELELAYCILGTQEPGQRVPGGHPAAVRRAAAADDP